MPESKHPTFGLLVLGKAIASTKRSFESIVRDGIIGVVSLAFGFGLFWYFHGLSAAMSETVTAAAFTLAPLGLVVLVVFLWNLFLAPAELAYEAIRAIPAAVAPPAKVDPPVNWAIWKARAKFTVDEFAAILAKANPSSSRASLEWDSFRRLILDAIVEKKLPYIKRYGENFEGTRYERGIEADTEIRKDDAIKWADTNAFEVAHIK